MNTQAVEGPLPGQVQTIVQRYLGTEARPVLEALCSGMLGCTYESISPDTLGSLNYWIRIVVQRRRLIDDQRLQQMIRDLEGLRGSPSKSIIRHR